METILVSEAKVKTIITSLTPKNATGYNGVPTRILKYCVHFISEPLTYIYIYIYIGNCSLTTRIFPERCTFTIVQPIYKKRRKKREETSNYRPISLLTVMPKILEIIMFKRLEQHLESNNIFATEQFGFKKGAHIGNAIYSIH
jgi:hypothetical protein